MRIAVIAVVLLLAVAAHGQDANHDGKVTYLVPINVDFPVSGAFGTQWLTELWLYNGSSQYVYFSNLCGSPCAFHAPGTTGLASYFETGSEIGPVMIHVPNNLAGDLRFSSRLFELSRHTQPAGVHLPVVREDQFFTAPARFIGIRSSASSRVAIRVYDPRRRLGSGVRLEFFDQLGRSLAETTLMLQYTNPQVPEREPGYAAIFDLADALPDLRKVTRFDLRVTPLDAQMEYWALVSVTDVETQQVLLISGN